MNYATDFKSIKDEVSPEEWQARLDLAACYRLVDVYGMTDLIYNHITARIPDTEHLLINLYGLLYKEITASNLVKIDVEGNIIWKYRDPSEVRLFGGRANVESTFQGQPYYVTNYGGLEVRHYLGERLILRVRGLGGFNDYPYDTITATKVAKRTDTFIEVGASIRYQMKKWLAFELGYTFLDLNSNFDEFDYTDNRVKASVILTY